MSDAMFDDLPILGELGASLRLGMEQLETDPPAEAAKPRRRWPNFRFLGTFLVIGLVGTTAAAGTLTLLRGSPIPGPKAEDTQPSMMPKRDSLKVLDLRAPDPDGGHLPFALRVGESEAGQTCATVGQVDGSDFGLVGQDGRFRELAAGIVDGCGDRVADAAAVVGARVLDAPRWEDVRTVLYGTGGDDVASAVVIARGRESPVKLKDGAFVFAVRGYPEDTALDLRLRFRDGHTAEHSYAAGRDILLEQDAPAWRAEMSLMDLHPGVRPLRQCITVADARPAPSGATAVPPLCVDTRDVHNQPPLPVHPWRFAARTFVPGDHGQTVDPVGTWTWRRPSGRTMVWGYALPQAVSEVVVRSPGTRSVIRPRLGGAVAVVLPPSTAPSDIRITIIRSGGGQVLLRGSDLKLGSGS